MGAAPWVLEADKEYLAARLLLQGGIAIQSKGTYNATTALELILKAYLAEPLGTEMRGHDLKDLAIACQAGNDLFFSDPAVLEGFNNFTPFQQLGRYGANAGASSDPGRVDELNMNLRGLMVLSSATIQVLDRLFLTTRSKIPASGKITNGLLAIMEQTSNHLFTRGWELPIPPLVVLSTGNRFLHLID